MKQTKHTPNLRCVFEYETMGDDGKRKRHTYDKPIEFPENAPMALHAINQAGYEIFHQEKLALRDRIEQLEIVNSEMLEALEWALHHIEETHGLKGDELSPIKQAIAKARGES